MKDKNKKDPDASAEGQEGNVSETAEGEGNMATEKACKKSMDLSGEDLEKSLGRLGEFAQTNDAESRKSALLQKAMEGDLEKSERDELFGLMGGQGDEPGVTHADTITKSMEENDTLQKALDVSDYLREQHEELCKSLTQLAEYQEQAESRQHEFNLILAKAISDTGTLVKAMSERLGVIAQQPARAPKSKLGPQQAQPLQKSFAGQAPEGEQLSKSMVLDTLDAMHVESMEKGMDGRTARGESILNAIAKYENSNMLSKSMLAEVQAYRQRSQATAH